MISLAALAALATAHADELDRPVAPLRIGDRVIDVDARPAVMGVVNLSRSSTYRESVVTSPESAVRRGRVLAAQGADVVDLGAESSNGGAERVGPDEQLASLLPVVRALTEAGVATSVETYSAQVAREALRAGARLLNLTGSVDDGEVFDLAAEHGAAVVVCHVLGRTARDLDREVGADPVPELLDALGRRVEDARSRGVGSIAVDPGLGFGFLLSDQRARARHQSAMLLASFRLRALGVPVCQSLPHSFALFEEHFRVAEPVFAVLAHLGGTGLYRTHEVPQVLAVLDAMRELATAPGQG